MASFIVYYISDSFCFFRTDASRVLGKSRSRATGIYIAHCCKSHLTMHSAHNTESREFGCQYLLATVPNHSRINCYPFILHGAQVCLPAASAIKLSVTG